MDNTALFAQHPGIILFNDFMLPRRLSAPRLAAKLDVSCHTVTDIVKGRRGVSTQMALHLADFFQTTPEYWLELQMRFDLQQCKSLHKNIQIELTTSPETESNFDWKEEMLRCGILIDKDSCSEIFEIYEMIGTDPISYDQLSINLDRPDNNLPGSIFFLKAEGWIEEPFTQLYIRAKRKIT
ncbi:MAG: HigA family addiction module antidote protein [Candidatus Melainabacteria bacterium]|nr:MAG: HigA family addiction module antidote protein [Candidatus Melainabacteria bacterium]